MNVWRSIHAPKAQFTKSIAFQFIPFIYLYKLIVVLLVVGAVDLCISSRNTPSSPLFSKLFYAPISVDKTLFFSG